MLDTALRGVDVSAYQGTIDWRAAARDGIRFAMLKATQGRSLANPDLRNFTDSRFYENVMGATEAGVACGAYHYLTAVNASEAVQEAEVFLSAVSHYKNRLTLGAAVDVEDSRLPRNKEVLTGIVRAFCRRVQSAGFSVMVYTNPDFLRNRLGDLSEFGLWLALWRDPALLPSELMYPNLRIWQWGTAAVDGIIGRPDANIGAADLLKRREPVIDYADEVQRRAGLADTTMQYLAAYRYGADLLRKLYEAMIGKKREE